MVVTVALASRHLPIEVLLETRENVAYLFRSSINAARQGQDPSAGSTR